MCLIPHGDFCWPRHTPDFIPLASHSTSSVFSSSPFTSAPPKHRLRRIPFVYLGLSKSIKKRRQCKHFALICSHKAVIKNRLRTICFVEVTARNKQKCDNYVLKIHVALSSRVPTGSYHFRVNTLETSLFQNIPIKMTQKWKVGGFGLFEYKLFFFFFALHLSDMWTWIVKCFSIKCVSL